MEHTNNHHRCGIHAHELSHRVFRAEQFGDNGMAKDRHLGGRFNLIRGEGSPPNDWPFPRHQIVKRDTLENSPQIPIAAYRLTFPALDRCNGGHKGDFALYGNGGLNPKRYVCVQVGPTLRRAAR